MENPAESYSINSSWIYITSPDLHDNLRSAYILSQYIESIIQLPLKHNVTIFIYTRHELH